MSDYRNTHSVNQSDLLNKIIRAIIIIIVSFLASIVFVSFAVHHMRLQFEEEYKGIASTKVEQVSDIVRMTVHGDDIVNNKIVAAEKYRNVFNLMLADTSKSSMTTETYILFSYSEGALEMLLSEGTDSAESFVTGSSEISTWLNSDYTPSYVEGENFQSVIVPISDTSGRCVGFFEYKVEFGSLDDLGDSIESRILTAVIISVVAGIVIFIIQLLIPKLLMASHKGGQHL